MRTIKIVDQNDGEEYEFNSFEEIIEYFQIAYGTAYVVDMLLREYDYKMFNGDEEV